MKDKCHHTDTKRQRDLLRQKELAFISSLKLEIRDVVNLQTHRDFVLVPEIIESKAASTPAVSREMKME